MHFGSRSQESVDRRQGIGNSHHCPGLRNGLVDGKDTIPEPGPHLRETSVERFGLFRVPSAFQLDATANFGKHQDARADLGNGSASNPAGNVRVCPVALAYFGKDVRIEQEFHRSTSRQSRWRGWSNMPSKASSGRSEPKTSKA